MSKNDEKRDNINKKRKLRRKIFMCKASEFAKYVINECLDRGLRINTSKLQKLLVLMQGEHLAKYDKPIFKEKVIKWTCGVAIKEVNDDFILGADEIKNTEKEILVPILETEKNVMNSVMLTHGYKYTNEINEDPRLMKLCENKKTDEEITQDEIKRIFKEYEEKLKQRNIQKDI